MNIRLRGHAMHLAVVAAFMSSVFASCIEPPLNLPAEDVIVDMPVVVTEMETVWNIDVDWQAEWYYGWDMTDIQISGDINYPEPTNYEVRRYYLGSQPGGRHTQEGYDGFTVFGTTFRRSYQFGYYDMLLWSNIDSPEGTQVLVVDDSSLDNVTATTTVTRGFTKANTKDAITGVYNQPEIFYSTFERDVYISRFKEDYDYVMEHLDSLVIKDVSEAGGYGVVFGSELAPEKLEELRQLIVKFPRRWIAQEVVDFKDLEILEDDQLVWRKADLRAFVVTGKETKVWKSGLTRFSRNPDSFVVNSSQGGGFKDTWVMTEEE